MILIAARIRERDRLRHEINGGLRPHAPEHPHGQLALLDRVRIHAIPADTEAHPVVD
jgi:hypothetical protein